MRPIFSPSEMYKVRITSKVVDQVNDTTRGIYTGMTRTNDEIKEIVCAETIAKTSKTSFLKGLLTGIKNKMGKS